MRGIDAPHLSAALPCVVLGQGGRVGRVPGLYPTDVYPPEVTGC